MPGPVFLRGSTIDLHPIDEEDLPFLQRLINEPAVWNSLSRAAPVTEHDEHEFYESAVHSASQEHLLVCVEGQPVGIVGLHDINHTWGVAELGYFIDPSEQGMGYASEAVEVFSEYAFNERRIAKLIAIVLANNEASIRVLSKNGFSQEGCLNSYAFRHGRREDVVLYGKLADHVH